MGKAEETKQAIIEKAAVIFNKNGYQRTSMSTLTKALGLTKGAIYGNFADKDALAVEAFRHSVRLVADGVRGQLLLMKGRLIKSGHSPNFSISTMISSGVGDARSLTPLPIPMMPIRNCMKRCAGSDAWEGRLVALVETAKERGEIRPDADAALFATIFIALIEGGILLAKTVGDKKYLEHSVNGINLLIDQMVVDAD